MNSFLQLAILFQMFSERLLGSAPNLKTALFSCPLIVNITNSGFFEVTFLFISKVILRTVRLLSLLFCKLSVGFSHNNIVMGVNLILITHTFCHPSLQSLYKVVTTFGFVSVAAWRRHTESSRYQWRRSRKRKLNCWRREAMTTASKCG